MMNGFNMGGAWFGMGIWWILIVVLLVAGGSILFRGPRDDRATDASTSARDILDARYARGEIDMQEYEEKKRKLAQ